MPSTLHVRIPFFGDQIIHLRNESDELYQLLKGLGEVSRLENKVMHLGIIHELGDVPSFGRWVHITTMLTLLEELKELKRDILGFGFNSEVSLLNGVKFTSSEEFLKCWTMIYSIGHLVGTFTSEHAMLRSILSHKEEFTAELTAEINEDAIKKEFEEIINKEKLFRIFKIFTTLKIFSKFSNDKFIELAKLNLLENKYLEQIDEPTQRDKLRKLTALFKFIRKLSFTLLDGYFSQNCVLLNHYYFLLNMDKMLSQDSYDQLLNSLNLFYTQTVYQSPENMFYHHEFAKTIEKDIFSKYTSSDSLIQEIIDNKIDKKLEMVIRNNKEKIRSNEREHFARITLKSITHPISMEKIIFRDISGGIIWNIPARYYEIDFYLSITGINDILRILNAVEILSRESEPAERINNFKELAKNIAISLLKTITPYNNFIIDDRKFGFYAILFNRNDLTEVIMLIREKIKEHIDSGTRAELKTSIEILEEVSIRDNSNIFIFTPNIILKDNGDKAQCDFHLISYNNRTDNIKIYISEIKKTYSKSKFGKDQIQKYLIYFLGLDEELSNDLASKLKDESKLAEELDDKILCGDLSQNRFLIEMSFKNKV